MTVLFFKCDKVYDEHEKSERVSHSVVSHSLWPHGLYCSPPGSSVHGILQTRILEWVAIPFSRGSSQPRDWTQVSCIAGRFFYCLSHQVGMLLLLLSRFSCVRLCATPEMAAHQAPPCLGFSRQEPWSGLPFPSPMHESEKWKESHSVVSDS